MAREYAWKMRLSCAALAGTVTLGLLALPAIAKTGQVTEQFSKIARHAGAIVDHGDFDRLLATFVKPHADGVNRVDFAGFKSAGHATLKQYIAKLEAIDVATLARAEQMSFWINLYNAKTLDIVLDRYPVKSILDIDLPIEGGASGGGPWKAKVLTVKKTRLSLDDIANDILRAIYKDPRVHFVLNCLSIGCPNLPTKALAGDRLEAQLEKSAREFVNHPRALSAASGTVTASSIYEWYAEDFGGSDGVLAHFAKYAGPELKPKLAAIRKIDQYAYDWKLIDVSN